MGFSEDAEKARAKHAEDTAKKSRNVEVARRAAHQEGVKRAIAQSVIIHGPAKA